MSVRFEAFSHQVWCVLVVWFLIPEQVYGLIFFWNQMLGQNQTSFSGWEKVFHEENRWSCECEETDGSSLVKNLYSCGALTFDLSVFTVSTDCTIKYNKILFLPKVCLIFVQLLVWVWWWIVSLNLVFNVCYWSLIDNKK